MKDTAKLKYILDEYDGLISYAINDSNGKVVILTEGVNILDTMAIAYLIKDTGYTPDGGWTKDNYDNRIKELNLVSVDTPSDIPKRKPTWIKEAGSNRAILQISDDQKYDSDTD